MNKPENHLTVRIPNPFDGSARERLKHMGLIDSKENLRMREMIVFARIFTGQFFDDLNEFLESTGDMITVYETFKALYQKEDFQRMFLLLSIQYDYMRKPLPDPVWWLAGDSEAIMAFMIYFMPRFEKLMTEGGLVVPGEEAGTQ